MERRKFFKNAGLLTSGAAMGLPQIGATAESAAVSSKSHYCYHGRLDDYGEFRVIDPGRVIQKIETFNQGVFAIGRILEDNGYTHYEEPCPYWELEWTAEVAAALKIPVAGGEQDNDLAQWRRMIRMNAVDIVQPDVLYLGGITRAWRVGLMARLAGKTVVPHSANHSLVTLCTLHLFAAMPNAGPMMEWSIEPGGMNKQAAELFGPNPFVKDGRAHFEASPGWGVKINPEWLKAAKYEKSERKV